LPHLQRVDGKYLPTIVDAVISPTPGKTAFLPANMVNKVSNNASREMLSFRAIDSYPTSRWT